VTEISKLQIVVCDENQKSKLLQKHQAGEGSVDLHVGGAVTAVTDGDLSGHRKLFKDTLILSGYHLSLVNCLAATSCYMTICEANSLHWIERFVCFVVVHFMHQSIETPTLWDQGKGRGFDIDPGQKASISLPPEARVQTKRPYP